MTSIFPFADAVVGFDWSSIVTNLGFGGFVMWFAWYTQTHTIPTLLEQHRGERDMARKDFLQAIADSRHDYLAAEDDQRKTYMETRIVDRGELNRMIDAVTKLAEATHLHVGEARTVWQAQGVKPEKQT